MRSRRLPLLVAFLVACDDPKPKEQGLPAVCTAAEDFLTRCNGNVLETCRSLSWQATRDCAAQGLVCDESVASCVRAGGSCTALTGVTAEAFYDTDIDTYAEISVETLTGVLYVENWPGVPGAVPPGSSHTVDLAAGHTNYVDCGVCVYSIDGSSAFFAQSGSVELTMPSATGEQMRAVLHAVELVEVDPSDDSWGTPLAGGGCRTADGVDIRSTTGHWPCWYVTNQDDVPMESGTYCDADVVNGQYHIWGCQGDCAADACTVSKALDCDAVGDTCTTAANATFTAICN